MPLQFTEGGKARSWAIAYTVLIGVVLLAVLPFTFLSLVKNNSGRDRALGFVPWLKASFCLFCLDLLRPQPHLDPLQTTIRAAFHLGYLSELFGTISAATVTVFLLLLGGPGMMHYAFHGTSHKFFDTAMRYSAHCFAAVVCCLALAFYGLSVDFQLKFTNGLGVMNPQDQRAYDRARRINELVGVTAVLLWVAGLGVGGLGVVEASTLYLLASLLNLVGSTWNFAYAVHWLLDMRNGPNNYVLARQIVLAWWKRGVVLIVGYFVAVKNGPGGGVWSGKRKRGVIDASGNGRESYGSSSRFVLQKRQMVVFYSGMGKVDDMCVTLLLSYTH
ncbi:hypothetical protein GE09DRAFT_1243499 [Coniochaeta sp. 2T2.1]|nr:hypothetical protein GE09DRAFT_1243499 [Coniochaeta sp. 2T2.1]